MTACAREAGDPDQDSQGSRFETALEDAEERYKRLLSVIGTGYLVIDGDGLVVDANEEYVRMTGRRTLEDIRGRSVLEWTAPHDRERNEVALRDSVAQGRIRNFEVAYLKPDGALQPIEVHASVTSREPEVRIHCVCLDISVRKRAEHRAASLNDLMEQLLLSRPLKEHLQLITDAAVHLFDADFARVWIIRTGDLCRSGCIHAQSTEGPHVCLHRDRCLHLMASAGRYTHLDGLKHRRVPFGAYKIGRIAAGSEASFITNDVTHDARVHDHEWARQLGLTAFAGSRLLSASGTPMGVLALFSQHVITPEETTLLQTLANVTSQVIQAARAAEERVELERQIQHAQKLESLGVLAGGIAHDFNNLLTTILGNLVLALDSLPPASPARSDLIEAETATRRAADLARQMLAYSGMARSDLRRLDLGDVIDETTLMLRVMVSKQVALEFRLAEGLPAIEADAAQLRQILMNLVANSSEAIGDRDGVATVSTGVFEYDGVSDAGKWACAPPAPGKYVFVEVDDTGCGIPVGHLGRIFDPFFSTKFAGRGLGLASVLGIVRSHKGAIHVRSLEGQGTTVKVFFPAAGAAPESLAPAVPDPRRWRGSGLLLLVDDEESVRNVARKILERLGFQVLMAAGGREAVELYRARASEIAAVLLDLAMPGMDGEDTFRELRRIRPDVKVLVASGFGEQEVLHRFEGQGLRGFLQKPYGLDHLRDALRSCLADC